MCLDILFHNFYLAMLSFSIGFVIGFWNLQQFIKLNTGKKMKLLFLDIDCYGVLWINYAKNGVNERKHGFIANVANIMKPVMLWNQQWNQ